jgi:hypothetical protein
MNEDFFTCPESVPEQKARLAAELAARTAAATKAAIAARAAAPIRGRPVDTTGDLFDSDASSAPLFATTNKQTKKEK